MQIEDRDSTARSIRHRTTGARRLFSNFAVLGTAELLCRAVSILVTLTLMKRLQPSGYGRVELAFSIIFWMVLIVRDFFESVVTRQLARKPRLTKLFVNRIITVKLGLAVGLYLTLILVSFIFLHDSRDRSLLWLYGFLLFSTSLGLDFVYRGSERIGLVAASMVLRTVVYSIGIWATVWDSSRILWVPLWLVGGEAIGIGLVWSRYTKNYGRPKPCLDRRFISVILSRGKTVCLIHLSQAVVITSDFVVVGMFDNWSEVGRYGAPLRIITAVMAFGAIFQQVTFPSLARSGRQAPEAGRHLVNQLVRILLTAFLPIAIGTTLLAPSLVRFLFPSGFQETQWLLAFGIWRAPFLCLAFFYQSSLIGMNRESSGVRLLGIGAILSFPLIAIMRYEFGLIGASSAVILIGLGLAFAGYLAHWKVGRNPVWHHNAPAPLAACCFMAVACLILVRIHVIIAVIGGAATYGLALYLLGGFDFRLTTIETSNPSLSLRKGSPILSSFGGPVRAFFDRTRQPHPKLVETPRT